MTDQIKCLACEQLASGRRGTGVDIMFVQCPRCGPWEFSSVEGIVAQAPVPEPRYLLSAWLRQRWKRTQRPFLFADRENGRLPVDLIDVPVPQKLDACLLLLAEGTPQCGNHVDIMFANDYPLLWAHNAQELAYFIHSLAQRKLVEDVIDRRQEGIRCRVTMDGWAEVARLQQSSPRVRQAFVAMWFHADLESAFESGIKPALAAAHYDPYRVDRRHSPDKIDDHELAQIRRSGILIADCTGLRPSVLFEAGFAKGLGIPVVWTCRSDHLKAVEESAFDVRQYPFVVWKDPGELKAKLVDKVQADHPIPLR